MKRVLLWTLGRVLVIFLCQNAGEQDMKIQIFETFAAGDMLQKVSHCPVVVEAIVNSINTEQTFQTISGFGGSLTDVSAVLLNRLSKEHQKIIQSNCCI